MAHNKKPTNIVLQLRRFRQGEERFWEDLHGDKICFTFLQSAQRSFKLLRTFLGSQVECFNRKVVIHDLDSPSVLEIQDVDQHKTWKVNFEQGWEIVGHVCIRGGSDLIDKSPYTSSIYCLHANHFLSRINVLTGEIIEQCKLCDKDVEFEGMQHNIEGESLAFMTKILWCFGVRATLCNYIAFITLHPLKLVKFSQICYESFDTRITCITENIVFVERENSRRKVFTLHRLIDVLDMGTCNTDILAKIDCRPTDDFSDIFYLGGDNPVKYIVKTLTDDGRETFQVRNLLPNNVVSRCAEYGGIIDSKNKVIPEGIKLEQCGLPYLYMKNSSEIDIYHMKSAAVELVGSIGCRTEECYILPVGRSFVLILSNHFSDQLTATPNTVYVRLYRKETCEMLAEKVLKDCSWSVDDVLHAFIDHELLFVRVIVNEGHNVQQLFVYKLDPGRPVMQ